ncbi:hypothetical protein BH10BDE1_BH10BDE1_27690 [soil metagenome]
MSLKFATVSRIAVVLVCASIFNVARAEEKVGNAEWKVRMQAMLTDILPLIPYAFDEAKFKDEKNRAEIQKSLAALANHSAALKAHTAEFKTQPNAKIDPSLRFIAEAFENEVAAAQTSFQGSSAARSQAQNYLRSAVSKCTMCHSQTSNGPELKLDQFRKQFETLTPSDRYVALIATRQFDDALKEFSKTLAKPKTESTDELAIDRTAKSALAIAVRVKRDPKLAQKLIQDIQASGSASKMLQGDLPDWQESVVAWQADKPIDPTKEKEVFAEAKRLFEIGQKKESSAGHFKNASVTMLRASTLLHDLLSNFPQSAKRAEAYLMLAATYDLLPGFTVWDLPDEYLAACIQENPHSEMSEKCFLKYESSVVLGYSGSSGTHIPSAVAEHVARMRALAKRTKK